MYLAEAVQKKWAPVLDHADLEPIKDNLRRSVTAIVLENTERALAEAGAHGMFQTLTEVESASTASVIPTNAMGGSSSTAGSGGWARRRCRARSRRS